MNNSSSQGKYPLVPPNEQKCVWMSAGILSYQLCDKQFDCDHCPLDSALRMSPEQTEMNRQQAESGDRTKQTKTLMQGYLYSKKHCWLKPSDRNSVRVGIEPHLASMLLNARTAVLPSIGDHVQANKACAWVVLEGGTLAITSPLDGEVQNTNAHIVDQPNDIYSDPFGRGWLFDITSTTDLYNSAALVRMPEAETRYADDERRFRLMVSNELKKHRATAGATLPDGGQLIEDISAMLGPEKYFTLLREVFC